jgi:hypothetical protein
LWRKVAKNLSDKEKRSPREGASRLPLVGEASAETYQDPKQIGQISLDMGGLLMEDAEARRKTRD